MRFDVSIQTEDFDLSTEIESLRKGDKSVGAVCSFVGTVRDRNDGHSVSSLELEHYPGMTEASICKMIDEARNRFDIQGAKVIHRIGLLMPLDQIVLVAVTSAHRGQSFQACEFLMDYLKTQAPFGRKRVLLMDTGGWMRVSVMTKLYNAGALILKMPAI